MVENAACNFVSCNSCSFQLFVLSCSWSSLCSCTWEREKQSFFSSQSSLQRESQPLQTFLIHTLILPFSLSFFDKKDDPSRLQYYSWRPTIVLLHSIIIFSGLFSKPPTSNSLAPCLYPLWHAEQSFSPSQPCCHSGIFPWVVTLSAAPLAL